MWIYVCGDQERSYYLREEAIARGHRITCPRDAQVVVLPLPRSQVSVELKQELGKGTVLVCGMTDDAFRREAMDRGWATVHIYDDEKYQLENAEDSAEGAVYALMREAPFALNGKSALVVGYGRLGKALKNKLESMGVKVTVAARDPIKRLEAGEGTMDIGEAMEKIGIFDMVVNTAPAQIIGKTALQNIKKGALLMDTASAPYGFNLEEAKHMRIHAWRENGIPGMYCPKTAAKHLMDLMERRCVL